jgi:hypothetical protein
MPTTPEYQREWRKNHPHYARDYMRRARQGLRAAGSGPARYILGIRVVFRYFHAPVSKERAAQEFLRLTD